MKILITSVGRRGYLVRYFKEALGGCGEIHVSNSSDLSPAFSYADAFVVTPLIYDDHYIQFLKTYCQKYKINVIISVFDVDILVLAKHKQEFEDIGVKLVISDSSVVEICNDKWKTYLFLKEKGFHAPATYLNLENVIEDIRVGDMKYPLVLKPRWGMGSLSIYIAENLEELKIFYNKVEKQIENTYLKYESQMTIGENVLIQEKLEGQEYGIDIINDLQKCFRACVIKKKYAMRAGETDCAITVENKILDECGRKLGKTLGHVGNLDVDIILSDNVPYILEMNARFGGGYPFSHVAGANFPSAIVSWLKGENEKSEWLNAKMNVMSYKDIQIRRL